MRRHLPWALSPALILSAHAPGTLSGRLRDASGQPVAGANIRLMGGTTLNARSDAEGRFAFTGLAPARYLLEVQHPAHQGVRRHVTLEGRHGVALELTLHPYSATVEVAGKAGFLRLSELDAPVNHLLGIADAAGEGIVTPEDVRRRAYARPGDVLENVPGLLISQHSGEGKANQYYLRGFNLDHGTDLRTTVAGMPVNLPTHGHGQGYTDLGFVIPELVSSLQYRKGGHFADEGDFATAGAVHLIYAHSLPSGLAQLEGGSFGHGRVLLADSPQVAGGHLLYAVEGVRDEGPWEVPEAFRKANLVLRWSRSWEGQQLSLTGMSYDARWTATDQVPKRALDAGLLGRFGSLDPTDGGATFRRSLSAEWRRQGPGTETRLSAYVVHQQLGLYSNFTYALADPIRGDQIEQTDRRVVSGLEVRRTWEGSLAGRPLELQAGLQLRQDLIAGVGLFTAAAGHRLETVREDAVKEGLHGVFFQARVAWSETFRSTLGLRGDRLTARVDSSDPRNSGSAGAGLYSPKVAVVLGPWRDTEVYLNAGEGFHSNDARGATLRVDPRTGEAAQRVTPLARARSLEVGLRSAILPSWQTTLSLWRLDLGSELVFSGDGGTTEPSRPSRRVGVEWANALQATPTLALQAEVAWSRARYADADPMGDRVPGAVALVASLGGAWRASEGWQLGLHLRHIGSRDLVEDGRARSRPATLLEANLRYQLSASWSLGLELFNLTDARTSDIDYFYTSRMRGEALPAADLHTHPAEPFSARGVLAWRF